MSESLLHRRRCMGKGVMFVEGISLSDGAYLKTNILPNGNMRADMVMSSTTGAEGVLWGARNGWNDKCFSALFNVVALNNRVRFDYGNNSVPRGVGQMVPDNNKHTYIIDKGKCFQDWINVYTFATTQFTCSFPLYIGAMNNAGSLIISHGFNIYQFRVFDNGSLIADFKPAIKNGVAGLFEIINNLFYTNQGAGSITPIY